LGVVSAIVTLTACQQAITREYDATATVIYTWQATYVPAGNSPDRPANRRIETFASVSLVNHNGLQPGAAVTGPDEQGLWWPALPPKPTIDDLESRLRAGERAKPPELIKSVNYAITFQRAGASVTLPTQYSVYRQATKAYPNRLPLALTLDPNQSTVLQADIQ
jgi:hypothetical protein